MREDGFPQDTTTGRAILARVRQRDESAAMALFHEGIFLYFFFVYHRSRRRRRLRRDVDGHHTGADDDRCGRLDADSRRRKSQALRNRAQRAYTAQKRPFPKPGTTEYELVKGQAVTF